MVIVRPVPSIADLDSILVTDELARRPARSPDLHAENAALHGLARQMAEGPEHLLETLVRMALGLCHAGTSGVSLVEAGPGATQVFRWVAMAGELAHARGGTTPRDFSPCGVTLERGTPQLFAYPGRLFTYFEAVSPPIVEGLVVPLGAVDGVVGTIWIVSHSEERHFDWEDARIMTSLAHFTAAAVRLATTAAENARLYREALAAFERGRRAAVDNVARLNRRQQEVAACIAEGLTNDQIAQRLVITPGTTANHVEGILRRLNLRGRTQIGVWAVERGLYRSDEEASEGEPGTRARRRGRSVGHQPARAQTDGHVIEREHDTSG
jgi:DNA-binding CsgD family transcriptional regulator